MDKALDGSVVGHICHAGKQLGAVLGGIAGKDEVMFVAFQVVDEGTRACDLEQARPLPGNHFLVMFLTTRRAGDLWSSRIHSSGTEVSPQGCSRAQANSISPMWMRALGNRVQLMA